MRKKRKEHVDPLIPPKKVEQDKKVQFSIRFPLRLLARVEALGRQLGYNKAEMIIRLVQAALDEIDKRGGK